MTATLHLINPELISMAKQAASAYMRKQGFVPGADQAMGGDPAAGGGDPAAMAAMGGGDPAAGGAPGGGGAAAAPAAPGGGADPLAAKVDQLTQMVQSMQQGGGGASPMGPMGSGGMKLKIDEPSEIMIIKNMLAKLLDASGVPISAQDMVATPEKLNAMAQGQPTSMSPNSGAAAGAPGGGAGGGGAGAIPPVEAVQPAFGGAGKQGSDERRNRIMGDGRGYSPEGLLKTSNQASALLRLRRFRGTA